MVVYATLSWVVKFLGWTGSNDVESALIQVVLPLAVAICVIFVVFGFVIKVRKAGKG